LIQWNSHEPFYTFSSQINCFIVTDLFDYTTFELLIKLKSFNWGFARQREDFTTSKFFFVGYKLLVVNANSVFPTLWWSLAFFSKK